jgi:hypothetical protein
MPFKLIYYSQQDPQWKNDILGFGEAGDTIGYLGCALTSVAMLVSGYGYVETPKTLNKKLKDAQGFAGAAIRWGYVNQIYPQISLKAFIPCATSDAPLSQIDASIAAGRPAIVQVDSSPASGIQTHWVVLYARKGDDYLMLDPWPYQTDVTKETCLMPRYAQGRTLKRAISHVILYDCTTADGSIQLPSGAATTPPQPQPAPAPVPAGAYARVKAEVTWGLNIRSSIDTSSTANVIAAVPAGTQLLLLESDGEAKIGAVNQWVRVREPEGKEGYAAAWYLEKVTAATPAPAAEPTSGSGTDAGTAPVSTPAQPSQPSTEKLMVVVSSSVGSAGLRMRKQPSKGAAVVAIQPAGKHLAALDDADKARQKIGKANQWLLVRDDQKRRGYVEAQYVQLG